MKAPSIHQGPLPAGKPKTLKALRAQMNIAQEYALGVGPIFLDDLFEAKSAAALREAYRRAGPREHAQYLAVLRAGRMSDHQWIDAGQPHPEPNVSIGLTRLKLELGQIARGARGVPIGDLDDCLYSPMESALEHFAGAPKAVDMQRFKTKFVRAFAEPLMRSLKQLPEGRNASYALLHSRVPHVADEPTHPGELLPLLGLMRQQSPEKMAGKTHALLTLVPRAGLLLHLILSHHLRSNYIFEVDQVDPVMSALALVPTLKAMDNAQRRDLATQGDIAVGLVGGQTFALGSKQEYLVHHVRSMTIARAQGCAHPEARIVEAFERFPKRLPAEAPRVLLMKGEGKELGHDFLCRVYWDWGFRDVPTSGVWECLIGAPEWRRAIDDSPISEAAGMSYGFLRALRIPTRPTPAQLQGVPELLTLLERQIPNDFHPTLFARTREYLAQGRRSPAQAQELSELWSGLFAAPGIDYAPWEGDAVHPWMEASERIAELLSSEGSRRIV